MGSLGQNSVQAGFEKGERGIEGEITKSNFLGWNWEIIVIEMLMIDRSCLLV